MTVRAVTFDFWGTLFRDAHAEERQLVRINALRQATGASEEDALAAFRTINAEFFRSHVEEQKTLAPNDAVRIALQTLHVRLRPEVQETLVRTFAMAILKHPPEPVEGALAAVQAAARHVPVGVISDSGMSPGVLLRRVLGMNGFMEHFWVLTVSDEVGVSKPQPAMFESAARGMGVLPSELLHIGDLEPTDIVGARRLGSRAALFAGVNDRFVGQTTADFTYRAWEEFVVQVPQRVTAGPA